MKRKICVVTGSRAEYGLLRWLISDISKADDLQLQILVTGMHLSIEFGLTYREIEKDGFHIDKKVEMLLGSDTETSIVKSMGIGMIGFADAFDELKPDLIVVLGDRFEILSVASAALLLKIPVAHIHGGEISEGAIDDSIRHAITKMSHLHFVAADQYRKRVIQLGESPERVFLVGALGLDGIHRNLLLNREQLEKELGIQFKKKNLLITFHPATLDAASSETQIEGLLQALHECEDTQLIFTYSNADAGGRLINAKINEFVDTHSNAAVFVSLGQRVFLSCLKEVDAIIGNSSCGLIEAPSLNTATINIGDRQCGRLKANSILDCTTDSIAISAAISKLYTPEYQMIVEQVINPYGEGNASTKVLNQLRDINLSQVTRKKFYDVTFHC